MHLVHQVTYTLPLIFDVIGKASRGDTSATFGTAKLSYSAMEFLEDTTMLIVHNRRFLGLYFNLGTKIHYKINGVKGTMRKNQYNLIYLPHAQYECSIEAGKYVAFSIHFTPSYLQLLKEYFPVVKELLANENNRTLASGTRKHLYCTPEILQKVHDLLHTPWKGICREAYLNAKIFDLLLSCVNAMTESRRHQNVPSELNALRKVEVARKYLLDNLHLPFSSRAVAEVVRMSEQRLRRAFKERYNTTMKEFLMNERMNKAVALLRDTSMPVEKIAASVGYLYRTNFVIAFKRHCGYDYRELRKSSSDDEDT